ncbi:MAG: S-layer homology domain-containing protein [Candidatus Gastranaerophilales bacterium]|nr:S-layer homology domain-containing protein [Candidatus Gastranaerophilales bacterium]
MNIKTKLATVFLSVTLLLGGISSAFAKDYTDVPDDYWAAEEIEDVVTKKIVPVYGDKTYRPLDTVTRVDWTEWLLRALGLSQAPITSEPNYSDVTQQTFGYPSIARSDQFGLIYGYTDGEFKPQRFITKVETASIMSHITKDSEVNTGVLNQFADSNEIPAWGVFPFSKAIKYGLYVNYPLETELNPNRELNRAEAAVLLARLMKALNLVEDDYKAEEPAPPEEPKEYMLSVEHLNEYDKAVVDRVNITNLRMIILAKNVFKVSFVESFNSTKHNIGDVITFYFKKDVVTKEGTLVIPANTKLYATIEELRDKKWLNKNTEVYLHFTKMVFPNGHEYDFIARVLNNDEGVLTENKWLKPLEYTVAGAAIGGAAIGLPVGAANDRSGDGMAIGFPTGAGVGLVAGFLTPGVNYKARANEDILIELKVDCSLYNDYVQQVTTKTTTTTTTTKSSK